MTQLLSDYLPLVCIVVLGILICMGILFYDIIRDTPQKDVSGKL
jgi:hypothetical protein